MPITPYDPRLIEGGKTVIPTSADPARTVSAPAGSVPTMPSTLTDGERMTAQGFGPVSNGGPLGQQPQIMADSLKKRFYFAPKVGAALLRATNRALGR